MQIELPQLLNSPKLASHKPEKAIVLVSDTELGAGDVCDSFTSDELLSQLVTRYSAGHYENLPVDLIFNGDNFDFIKVKVDGDFPRHVTAQVATKKVDLVHKAHQQIFAALAAFAQHSSGNKHLYFITGNHDQELLFPEVQAALKKIIGSEHNVHFIHYEYLKHGVMTTHGQQHDPTFRVDPAHPFIEKDGERYLNLPFMTYALLDTMCPLKEILPEYEQIKPYEKLFHYYPLARKAVVRRARNYTMRAIFVNPITKRKDFTLQLSRETKKQWIRRLIAGDMHVHVEEEIVAEAKQKNAKVVLIGHLHDIQDQTLHGVRLLKVGSFRDEYGIKGRNQFYPIPKSWAEIIIENDQPSVAKIMTIIDPAQKDLRVTTYELLETGAVK